jgi:hypothetical protein
MPTTVDRCEHPEDDQEIDPDENEPKYVFISHEISSPVRGFIERHEKVSGT